VVQGIELSKKDYELGIKVGALFGVLWGALEEPFQALGFVGLYDVIHGKMIPIVEWLNVVSSVSIIEWIIYILAGVMGGVIYALIFVRVRDRIPTERTITKSIVLFSVGWLIVALTPSLLTKVGDIVRYPWAREPYLESVVVSFVLTLFWGALFGCVLQRSRLGRSQDAKR